MNTAEELLNAIHIQDSIENDLTNQCLGMYQEVSQRREEVKKEWLDFIHDAFPEEILSLIDKYLHGQCLYDFNGGTYRYRIEISRSIVKFKCLIVDAGNTWVNIFYSRDEDVLSNESLTMDPMQNSSALSNRAKNLENMHIALQKFKDTLPTVYEEIMKARKTIVAQKTKDLETICNTKIEQPKKKYKIEITVEE